MNNFALLQAVGSVRRGFTGSAIGKELRNPFVPNTVGRGERPFQAYSRCVEAGS